jgi:hypothetical protein
MKNLKILLPLWLLIQSPMVFGQREPESQGEMSPTFASQHVIFGEVAFSKDRYRRGRLYLWEMRSLEEQYTHIRLEVNAFHEQIAKEIEKGLCGLVGEGVIQRKYADDYRSLNYKVEGFAKYVSQLNGRNYFPEVADAPQVYQIISWILDKICNEVSRQKGDAYRSKYFWPPFDQIKSN